MTRIQYRERKEEKEKPQIVHVFDEDQKRVYFHNKEGTPDYMDASEFHKNFKKDEQ